MKPNNRGRVFCLAVIWLVMAPVLRANDQSNPFQSIPERNCFALKPPPPPPSNEPPPAPPPVLAKVVLTGVTSMFGPSSKRALLEIEETEPGKQKNIKKPILREGERDGAVEVLSIDLDKGIVKIRNNGFETNLNFPEQKSLSGPVAAAPGAMPMPGRVPMPGMPGMPYTGMATPGVPSASGSPIIIPRRGAVGSEQNPSASSVVPYGANPSGSTGTSFTPATTPGATGYRAYPGTYRGGVAPSAVPMPPGTGYK